MFVTPRKVTAFFLSILFCFSQKMFAMESMGGGAASSSDTPVSEKVIYDERFFENFATDVTRKLLTECVENRCLNKEAFERVCKSTDKGSLFHLYYEKLRSIKDGDLDKPYRVPGSFQSDDVRLCSFQWQMCVKLFKALKIFMCLDSIYHALHKEYADDFACGSADTFLDSSFPISVLLKNIFEKQNVQELDGKQALKKETIQDLAKRLYQIAKNDTQPFPATGDKSETPCGGGSGDGSQAVNFYVQLNVHNHYGDTSSSHSDAPSTVRVEEVHDNEEKKDCPKSLVLCREICDKAVQTDVQTDVQKQKMNWRILMYPLAMAMGIGFTEWVNQHESALPSDVMSGMVGLAMVGLCEGGVHVKRFSSMFKKYWAKKFYSTGESRVDEK